MLSNNEMKVCNYICMTEEPPGYDRHRLMQHGYASRQSYRLSLSPGKFYVVSRCVGEERNVIPAFLGPAA